MGIVGPLQQHGMELQVYCMEKHTRQGAMCSERHCNSRMWHLHGMVEVSQEVGIVQLQADVVLHWRCRLKYYGICVHVWGGGGQNKQATHATPMPSAGRLKGSQQGTARGSRAVGRLPTVQKTTPTSTVMTTSASGHTQRRPLSWLSRSVSWGGAPAPRVGGVRSADCPNRGASSTSSWWLACLGVRCWCGVIVQLV